MEDIVQNFLSLIPKLNYNLKKGDLGRIAIFGGSQEYTGAPYFAGITALNMGADLVYIFCPESAAVPIKCYSPDLIVIPHLDKNIDSCVSWLKVMDVVIIGPGLGRNLNSDNIMRIFDECCSLNLPVIFDADGLNFISKNDINLTEKCILTPNKSEFERLITKYLLKDCSQKTVVEDTIMLGKKLNNPIILKKGDKDSIHQGDKVMYVDNPASMKRCGGQGDMLAGMLAVFCNWALKSKMQNPLFQASTVASFMMRKLSFNAYEEYGRNLTGSKLIDYLVKNFKLLN